MDINLNQGEKILREYRTSFWNVKSPAGRLSAQSGTVVITNQRFLLYKVSTLKKVLFGALSLLFGGSVLVAELVIAEISDMKETRPVGMAYNYIITTTNGLCYGIAADSKTGELIKQTVTSAKVTLKVNSNLTSDEALAKMKKAKEKLELGIITQLEYDALKSELSKFID